MKVANPGGSWLWRSRLLKMRDARDRCLWCDNTGWVNVAGEGEDCRMKRCRCRLPAAPVEKPEGPLFDSKMAAAGDREDG